MPSVKISHRRLPPLSYVFFSSLLAIGLGIFSPPPSAAFAATAVITKEVFLHAAPTRSIAEIQESDHPGREQPSVGSDRRYPRLGRAATARPEDPSRQVEERGGSAAAFARHPGRY